MKNPLLVLISIALLICSCKKEDAVVPGESCTPNKTLTTQNEVDALGQLGCTEITGDLIINDLASPQKITSLAPLANLTSVKNRLVISTKELRSLDGLQNLTSVGYLRLMGNLALEDISALSGVVKLTGPVDPNNLCTCAPTQNLINENKSLRDLSGLSSVKTVASGLILGQNPVLENIDGLSSITNIAGQLVIEDNYALEDLLGLSNVEVVGWNFVLRRNHTLKDLKGLEKIRTVKRSLIIEEHNNLENLDALTSLNRVDKDVAINNNAALSTCCGLYSLFCSNPPDCTNWNVGGSVSMSGNRGGCAMQDIVQSGPC